MSYNNKELQIELQKVNKDIKKVNDKLIKDLQTIGIQNINLYSYINLVNNLEIRQNKLQYRIASNI